MGEDGVFDVFGYLKKIRGLRRGLVETQDQYKFIYDSLEEYCRGIDSRFPVSDLANKIKEKTVKDKKIKKNAYAFEYALICNQTPRFTIGDCAAGIGPIIETRIGTSSLSHRTTSDPTSP